MRKYAAQRLALGIPTIFGAALLIFAIMRIAPGDVATMIAIGGAEGEEEKSVEAVELIREKLGLNQPLHMQFANWMWDLAHWDLGQSLWTRQPVKDLLVRRYPLTLQLSAMALLLSWLIAIPVGILSAVKQDTPLDYIPRFLSIIGLAIPNFWLGILTMTYLAAVLGWVPALTYSVPWRDPLENFSQLMLPAVVLGTALAALQTRMTRATMLDVLREDYIRTANAKGLGSQAVLWRHALKNAAIPIITISGTQLGGLISGSLVTEVVFNLPGLGSATVDAVRLRDYPVIQSLVLFITVAHIIVNLGVDLLYGFLDPRIRYADY
jgi:peptide/nickel transport system permease protein